MNKILSIIIPVYNIENYIAQCIDSLLCDNNQFEIILVDDGSTDNSSVICDRYAAMYPRLIKVFHNKNQGVSSARNFGLKKAIGKYIYFVDGDDYVSGIDVLLSTIQSCDCEGFLLNYNILDKNDDLIRNHIDKHIKITVDQLIVISERHFHAPWGYIFRKDIIENDHLVFCYELKYAEDWVFILQYLSLISELKVINGFTYNYRKERPGSAMNKRYDGKQILLHFKAFDYIWSIKSKDKDNSKYIQHEKLECFSYILNVVKYNTNLVDINEIQQKIRRRIKLSMLKGANIKFIIKIFLAYINVKLI